MNETNRSNYVVDLGYNDTKKKLGFYDILHHVAREQKWQMLGMGRAKRYFRFGYIDSVIDPEFKGESGFYYWSADSMRSSDYKEISFEKAVELLISIDKTITEEVIIGLHKARRYNSNSITIGCRRVDHSDVNRLVSLFNSYKIESVDFVLSDSNSIRIKKEQLNQLLKLVQKG